MLAQTLSPLEVGAMTHLDPDQVSDNGASCETQDKQRRSAPVPIVGTRMQQSELLMPDHAPSSILTYSPTPRLALPAVSQLLLGLTELDYSKILDVIVRKTGERATAKEMKVWENSVKKILRKKGQRLGKSN